MDLALDIDSRICYYDILGVHNTANEDEIKKAYKQLALKIHPDKVGQEYTALCTKVFQKIKDAYQCLSNTKDRKWYDSHRKFIIKEAQEEDIEGFTSNVNIWNYFGTCYNGFGDQIDGFFSVYRNLFEQIAAEEMIFNSTVTYPNFGNSASSWDIVNAFYKFWSQFTTSRLFSKEYKLCEAENRQIRRLMEKENKKNDAKQRREFSENIRKLCCVVKKRDPRVEQHVKEIGIAKALKAIKIEKEKNAAREASKIAREEKLRAQKEYWIEMEKEKECLIQHGQTFLDTRSDSSKSDTSVVIFHCEPCDKTFKSEKQLESHIRSKKHISIINSMK